ncbi:MAG: hypothetical protein C0483_25055 [Pirellula sp.]|nr:hypothetical protein [Pirellula sp.]
MFSKVGNVDFLPRIFCRAQNSVYVSLTMPCLALRFWSGARNGAGSSGRNEADCCGVSAEETSRRSRMTRMLMARRSDVSLRLPNNGSTAVPCARQFSARRPLATLFLLLALLLLGAIAPLAAARGDDLSLRAGLLDTGSDADFAPADAREREDDSLEAADEALAELTPEEAAELAAEEEAAAFNATEFDATANASPVLEASLASTAASAAEMLADNDELWIVSARRARLTADGPTGFDVWRYDGSGRWQTSSVAEFSAADTRVPVCLHVHGNRVTFCDALCGGWAFYTKFTGGGCKDRGPIRWVIFTWPSDRLNIGSRKDVQIKAVRAECYGYYLAYIADRLPAEARVSMIGYSFGTRVISASLHILGGGTLRGRALAEHHVQDRAVRTVLLAGAMDNDCFMPGRYMQMAPSQIDRLLVGRNHLDPAMKWYPLLYELTLRRRQGQQSLGYTGLAGLQCIPDLQGRVEHRDLSCLVGREHDTHGCRYLAEGFVEVMRGYVYYEPLGDEAP